MQYPDAVRIAEDIRQQFEAHCEVGRCFIAGSIRRKKADIGDVEIVCQPKTELHESKMPDLFGEQVLESVTLRVLGFCEVVDLLGRVIQGEKQGRMMKIELPYDGLMLDLFLPEPYDFFRVLAIRTGSREFSQHVIATAWRKNGWVGTPDGLRKEEQCIEKVSYVKGQKKSTWKCTVANPVLPPEWQDEREFFEWLRVPFVVPEKRF